MPAVQSSYSATQPIGFPGKPANMTNWDGDTRIAEATIPFGVACQKGTADKSVIKGAAAATGFVGLSIADITLPIANGDNYVDGENVGIATEGDWFVTVGGDVTEGGDVTFDSTTGVLSSAGTSGTQFAITGAKWMTTTASGGIGIVRLSGHLPAA